MYALDHDHDSAQPQRIAELEARVDWLETAIAQILGEPPGRRPKVNLGATPKPAPKPEEPPVEFDLWMLRTQGMPTLAPRPAQTLAESATQTRTDPRLGNTRALSTITNLARPMSAQAPAQTPTQAPPQAQRGVARADLGLTSALAAIGLAPTVEMPADATIDARYLAKTQPMSMLASPAMDNAFQPRAPSTAATDFMGITAAFATLDAQLTAASATEAALTAPKPDLLPWVDINPDLIDAAFARPKAVNLDVRCSLEEQYPSIAQKITAIWRSPEIHGYLKKLIVDDRGDRNGFDPSVMSELIALSSILEQPARANEWSTGARML